MIFMPASRDMIVLWPTYFNAECTRSEGRKVQKKIAIKSPSVEDIAAAVKSLGLRFKVEEDKSYPTFWWKKEGRVLVEKKNSKSKLIKEIAAKMSK